MTDHMKFVAKRHAGEEQKAFFKYLRALGWTDDEIEEMWDFAERIRNDRNNKIDLFE